MKFWKRSNRCLWIAAVMLLACGSVAFAQAPAAKTYKPYTVPKTPWGDPDLQGVWPGTSMVGVPMERAQAEIDAVSRRLEAAYPEMRGRGAQVWRVRDFTVRDVRLSLLVLLAHGGEAHAAIAEHDGRGAVPGRRREDGIPGGLTVIVRVHIDPPRRDDPPVGLDLAPGRTCLAADLDDPVAVDSDVARARRRSRAVNDTAAPDDDVVHCLSF